MHSDQDPNSSDYEEVKDSDLPPDDDIDQNEAFKNNKKLHQ